MPKRSNQFQKLIKFITDQLVPEGATVEESVELEEMGVDNSSKREVDILIQYDIGIAPIRIAIECRDRTRKDDITWIDGIAGKYKNLPVNKVIAISNSGFSSTALQKAELNNIETLTLEEATKMEWQKHFLKLGIAQINQRIDFHKAELTTVPALKEEISPD